MKLLNTEYTKYNSEQKSWKNGLFSATVLLVVFVLFQPFGFREKDLALKLVLLPGFSLIAFLYSVTDFIIVRKIIKTKKRWTLINELLFLTVSMFPVTFVVHLISWWFTDDMPLNLYWYLKLFYHVSSLFLLIIIVEFLYYSSKSAGIKIEQLASRIDLVSHQPGSIKEDSKIETVTVSLEKDSIDINRNKMVFIKSIGNYLEFYFRESDGQIKKIVKRGRMHQAEKDMEAFPEFLRCHRAFIINLKQAKQIKGNSKNARLVFDQKLEEIPVSRAQFKTMKEQLDKIIAG